MTSSYTLKPTNSQLSYPFSILEKLEFNLKYL
jgi:hypothetical protein